MAEDHIPGETFADVFQNIADAPKPSKRRFEIMVVFTHDDDSDEANQTDETVREMAMHFVILTNDFTPYEAYVKETVVTSE